MKYLAAILFVLVPAIAFGAPFLTSNPSTENPDGFILILDGQSHTVPAYAVTGGKILHYDLAGIAPGTHSGTVIQYKNDPLWGRLESETPTPFSFVRPANMGNVTGIGLSAQ